jgi:hypothetical protein
MTKKEFWNNLAGELRHVTDYQLDRERWSAMDMVGEGNTLALVGGLGAGIGLLVNRVIESKIDDSLVGKIVKNISRGFVVGSLVAGASGVWYSAESWRALGLVMHEGRRRSAYLTALPEKTYDQVIRKSVREDGRGPYFVAKDMMGASY